MTAFILATKIKQVAGFDEQKKRRVYTVLKSSPCYVTQIKTVDKDGYLAIQIGFSYKKKKNIKKTILGQTEKAGIKTPLSFLAEIRLDSSAVEKVEDKGKQGYKIDGQTYFSGTEIKPEEVFKLQDKVLVKGTTKGKGFAGVVKRHGFAGGPKTHGQSDRLRAPGSIGSGTTPGRVWKGKKMAGRMGQDSKTIKGLKVAKIDNQQIWLQGLVPGPAGGVITVIKQ
jgi:large subunit ribosomal protein L3